MTMDNGRKMTMDSSLSFCPMRVCVWLDRVQLVPHEQTRVLVSRNATIRVSICMQPLKLCLAIPLVIQAMCNPTTEDAPNLLVAVAVVPVFWKQKGHQ